MNLLSDMLTYLRKREGLSQQELADKLGMTRSAIGMYETGKREPDLETLEAFADFYNVDMNTLTGRNEFFLRNEQTDPSLSRQDSLRLKKITNIYLTLNEDGKNYLMAQADFASGRKEYLASPPQAKHA